MSIMGVGVVGPGWVAGEHIRAFGANEHTEVRGVCSRSLDRAKAAIAQHGLAGCRAFDDYAAMFEQDDIDIVVVCTPPHVHPEQAVAAAQAGKHIVLEKAIANSLEEATRIRDAVAKAGVRSVVSFVLRWNPLFDIIKATIAGGAVGELFYGEVDYFHGSGPWYAQFGWNVKKDIGGSSLLSAGCHALDALRWFMGGDAAEVMQYRTRSKNETFAPYEYEPTTVTLVRFTDGRIGKVTSCLECTQPYTFHIDLKGSEGTVNSNRLWSKRLFPGQTDWASIPTVLPDSGQVSHHPFVPMCNHFVDCIQRGVESHCNIADAFKTHAVIYAADRSGETGHPVVLP